MKTIGLIGGMSWESTATYYQVINERVRERLGGLHSAKILMESVDFAEIAVHQFADEWDVCAQMVGDVALRLERAGADFLVISTNTMHKVAPQIEARLSCPLLHIADAAALALQKAGIQRVALLGTKTTMVEPFYKERLKAQGFDVMVPDEPAMERVDHIIFDELCRGIFDTSSRQHCRDIIAALVSHGAEGILLGCTEIGLLVKQEDSPVPLFDTTWIHARQAADLAMTLT